MTPKHKLFVTEYLKHCNATKAAISAGYSKRTAYSAGQRLLKHVEVSAELNKKTTKMLEKNEITVDRVIAELGKMAFLDPRKLFASDGSLIPIHELDDDSAASIAGLEVNELFEGDGEQKHAYGLLKKIKIADKGQNLERLGRYFKLFTDKVEVSVDRELAEALGRARKRTNR